MAEQIKLSAASRTETGGSAPKRLRRQGSIPGIIYGGKIDPRPVLVPVDDVAQVKLHDSQVIELKVDDRDPQLVIVKEIQVDTFSHSIDHIDFLRIARDEKLVASVSIVEFGEPVGVSRDGGVLAHLLREIEVRCLPNNLPEQIEVDVSELELGESIHASELDLPEEVELVTDPEAALFTITVSRAAVAEDEAEEETEEEGVEGEETEEKTETES